MSKLPMRLLSGPLGRGAQSSGWATDRKVVNAMGAEMSGLESCGVLSQSIENCGDALAEGGNDDCRSMLRIGEEEVEEAETGGGGY